MESASQKDITDVKLIQLHCNELLQLLTLFIVELKRITKKYPFCQKEFEAAQQRMETIYYN